MPQIEPEVVTSTNGTFPLPATLSDDVITGVLREKLGYDGIVITDALNMQAIADNFTESEAVLKTFDAGVDIALMPTILRSEQDVTKLDRIFKDVIAAVKDGRLSEERIDQSVERILTLKAERGIWNGTTDTTSLAEKIAQSNQIVGSPEHKAKERAMTEAAVTLVKNDQRTLPFKPKKNANVLVIAPAADQTDSMKKNDRFPTEESELARDDSELLGYYATARPKPDITGATRCSRLHHRRFQRQHEC